MLPGFSYNAAIARLNGAFRGSPTYESLDEATIALSALGSRLTGEIEVAFMAAVRDSESHAA